MSKKNNGEQPVELNDADLEATSGGTIFVGYNNTKEVYGYTDVDGNIQKADSFEDALMLNGKKAAKKQIKQLEDAGFTVWKPYFD